MSRVAAVAAVHFNLYMAVNSDTSSHRQPFSLAYHRQKENATRSPRVKISDIRQRQIIKAAGIGRRQPVKNNDEEQSSRLRRVFMISQNKRAASVAST